MAHPSSPGMVYGVLRVVPLRSRVGRIRSKGNWGIVAEVIIKGNERDTYIIILPNTTVCIEVPNQLDKVGRVSVPQLVDGVVGLELVQSL